MASLRIACTALLFAIITTADIVPSNTTTGLQSYRGTLELQNQKNENISKLVPITRSAANVNSPLVGNLYYTIDSTLSNLTVEDIAYISCNPADYDDYFGATKTFEDAYKQNNITAIILYSTDTNYCDYTGIASPMQDFRIFSMTSKEESQMLLNATDNMDVPTNYPVSIAMSEGSGNNGANTGANTGANNQPQNPLGPSPSTAVAMIILYSITGIITALFLVIIITGAVRAHRHPDRYGPRDVLGRPRQSRARGLGRAILDTLPIVKFGQPEPPKPTDVELGPTTEARDDPTTNTEARDDTTTNTEARGINGQTGETISADHAEFQRNAATDHPSGIAAALPVAAGAVTSQDSTSDEGLGCSICTDDFEQGQDIRVLPCSHKFHPDCVDPWLLNVSGTCPLCRVDLRPVNSRGSIEEEDPEALAPPIQPESMSHRRRSMFRDVLAFRSRPNASTEERISALRRLREQRINGSGDVAGPANESTDDVANARRSRRLSTRFTSVFGGGRTRGTAQEEPQMPSAEASSSGSQQASGARDAPSIEETNTSSRA